MPSAQTIGTFVVAALVLLVVPGPSVLYLVTQSVANGRRGGLAAMAGVQAAGAVHVVLAAVGLSAVIARSATAFAVVKYAGAAYLIWLGIQRLRHGTSLVEGRAAAPLTAGRLARQGFLVNLLNPKSALFFVAVLPQFVDRTRGDAWLQILLLGGIFLSLAVLSDGAWVLASGSVSGRLRSRRAQGIERVGGAGALIALGLLAAVQGEG